jgi:hypothetical protein
VPPGRRVRFPLRAHGFQVIISCSLSLISQDDNLAK